MSRRRRYSDDEESEYGGKLTSFHCIVVVIEINQTAKFGRSRQLGRISSLKTPRWDYMLKVIVALKVFQTIKYNTHIITRDV